VSGVARPTPAMMPLPSVRGVIALVEVDGMAHPQPPTAPPAAPLDDPAVDETLNRCVAAVTASGARRQYPPPAQ
jgi:hypothetical protein